MAQSVLRPPRRLRSTAYKPPATGVPPRPSPTGDRLRWRPAAVLCMVAAIAFALFVASLRGIDLTNQNGLGLLSVLPPGALISVAIVALAFVAGLTLPRPHPVGLGVSLITLVVCLNGISAFIEPQPRFPTAYQIAGYVDYVSRTGHTAPSLAAYFSWPGFFTLMSFITGAAGIHSLLFMMKIWPTIINLLYLAPLFLLMRNLRFSWRAQWLAGFLFVIGNWVGQDYFSPQSFGLLLYLLFLAILVNWFTDPTPTPSPRFGESWIVRAHRRIFGVVVPGERPLRVATTRQRAFLLWLLVALFLVATFSHQLTPLFMIAACAGLVLARRCTVRALPILLGVILAGYISFEAVGYWSGHLSNVLGGIGNLGFNLRTSVSGRLLGNSPSHLIALHAKVALGAAIVGLAAVGLLRRRLKGIDDRVLLVLVVIPVVLVAAGSYGGEIALRTYLFMLPAACLLAAAAFFPDPRSTGPHWMSIAALASCAVILPISFFLARYGNEAFERVPQGELAAANWVYAHDSGGTRLLWLSSSPEIDVTPQMPWAYRDIDKVVYVPALAPRDPADVGALVDALRNAGPGSYLIATETQVAALQQTASYPPGWGSQFERAMTAAPGVRVAFRTDSATVYKLDWAPGAPSRSVATPSGSAVNPRFAWTQLGEIALWLVVILLAAIDLIRLWRPHARLRVLWMASLPLLLLLGADIAVRFAVLS